MPLFRQALQQSPVQMLTAALRQHILHSLYTTELDVGKRRFRQLAQLQ